MLIGIDISLLRIAQSGVLVYQRNLVEYLAREGGEHRFTLLDVLPLNPGRPMQPLAAFDAGHVRVVRCAGIRRGYLSAFPALRQGPAHAVAASIDRALDPAWSWLAIAEMGLELRAALRGVEVFHASEQLPYAPPGAAVVLTIHDLTTRRFPELHVPENAALHARKEHFARARADRIIAVSNATRDDIVRELGVPAGQISVVYEAADDRFRPYTPAELAPVLARYGLRPGEYILSVGAIEPRKNYARLIEAYAALHARYQASGQNLPPLVIAGGNGWLYEATLATPGRLGIAGQVRFPGRVPDADLPALIAGTKVFVYPSLYEGFGLPPLEALASEVPVIVSRTSSLPEVVGDAGLYCDPLDSHDLARQLATVLENPAVAANLRQMGPERARRFSWARTARETLDVYAQARAERSMRQR